MKYRLNKNTYLTDSDKIELITFMENFSLPDKIFITTSMYEWVENIDANIESERSGLSKSVVGSDKKYFIDNPYKRIIMMINTMKFDSNDSKEDLINILNMPASTCEQIGDILFVSSNYAKKYCKENKELLYFLVFTILEYKFEGFGIYNKHCSDVRPSDEFEYIFSYNKPFIILKTFKLLFSMPENQRDCVCRMAAILIYLLAMTFDTNPFEFSSLFTELFFNEDMKNKIMEYLSKLNGGENISILDISNEIQSLWTPNILSELDRLYDINKKKNDPIIENNIKDELSIKTKCDNLFFGDNIIDSDKLDEFAYKIFQITEEFIKRYVGKDKNVSFDMTEFDAGYILYNYNKNIKICTLLKYPAESTSSFRYMIKKPSINDDEIYLLFKIDGDNKLYGISVNSLDNKNTRRIISFNPSLDYKYRIVMGGGTND